MANQQINPLQLSYTQSWAGLTTEKHLSNIHQLEPQLASAIVTKIFSQERYDGLMNLMNQYPVKTMDTDIEYRWMLKGDDRRAINIVSFSAMDSTRPGIGKTTFELELEEDWFEDTDFITFDDREYGVRVIGPGRANGTACFYTVEHMSGDDAFFIPPALLQAGRMVSKQASLTTNTLNDQFAGTNFTSHFIMQNTFTTLSKKYLVPGNMHDRKLLIGARLPNGETTTIWTIYQEMKVDWEWEIEKANELFFGKSNLNVDSTGATNGTYANKAKNGFAVKRGAGLRQQIAPTYKFYYTQFNLDDLFNILTVLSVNILPEDQRKFVMLTGERGMTQFHRAVEANVALLLPLGVPERNFGPRQSMGFGGQYRTYWFPNGIEVTVMKMKQYDDVVDNRIKHPEGGPMESYRYTIMNFGTTDGEANIQRVVPKNRTELHGYVHGLTGPFGPNHGQAMAEMIDGYKVARQTTQGIMLRNPLSCAEYIYNGVSV